MKIIKRYVIALYSLICNLKFFDLKTAMKIPVYFAPGTKFKGAYKGCILLPENFYRGMIQIGFIEVDGEDVRKKSCLFFQGNGKLIFHGVAQIGRGVSIRIYDNATITIGCDFQANQNLSMICKQEIFMGEDVLLGWNVLLRDTDGHKIFDLESKKQINEDSKIMIDNNVWIGSNASIFKGVRIGTGSVIGGGSLVVKDCQDHSVSAGIPAKEVRHDIYWEK